jgi:hypothetical protein
LEWPLLFIEIDLKFSDLLEVILLHGSRTPGSRLPGEPWEGTSLIWVIVWCLLPKQYSATFIITFPSPCFLICKMKVIQMWAKLTLSCQLLIVVPDWQVAIA